MPSQKLTCAFYGIMPDMKAYLRAKLKGHRMMISEHPLEPDKLDKATEVLGVFVDSRVDKKVMASLPKLKLIVTLSTGYDHIDCREARKRKISVRNVPTYGENTVAQHALSLLLALSRKLFVSIKRVKEGGFDYHGLRGFDLKGKTIGIIGTGHIGLHLIDMLAGFEANLIAYDAYPIKKLQTEHNFKYVGFHELLKQSDMISLHVPLFPETHHLLNKKTIKKMKRGVFLVNTARGELIDSEALVWGLTSGQVAGAGLDVLESEDLLSHPAKLFAKTVKKSDINTTLMTNIIIDHPNTIVTPHNAFNSREALERIFNTTIENIKSFIKHEVTNEVALAKKK